MESLKIFREEATSSNAPGNQSPATGSRPLMGYLCSWVPEELILAAGYHPVRLFGTGADITLADRHLQSYACSLVRGALETGLRGELAAFQGVIFPHTCDSIQRLSDIWRLHGITPFHADLVLPVKLTTASAKTYLIEVLERLREELGTHRGVTITDDELREAIVLMNRIRRSLKRINEKRSASPGIIAAADLHLLNRVSMTMDRSKLASALLLVEKELAGRLTGGGPEGGKRILLAGGFCDLPEVHQAIEDAGAHLVADDLCVGSRAWTTLTAEDRRPLIAIAESYLERPLCPAKHRGLTNRADHLLNLARQNQVDGIIFTWLKFCDPHSFDYPYLKASLDQGGIPSLLLELENRLTADGQLKTRIEAFLETI